MRGVVGAAAPLAAGNREGGGEGGEIWEREERSSLRVREGKGANSVREGDRRRWPTRRRRRSEVNQREMRDGGRV